MYVKTSLPLSIHEACNAEDQVNFLYTVSKSRKLSIDDVTFVVETVRFTGKSIWFHCAWPLCCCFCMQVPADLHAHKVEIIIDGERIEIWPKNVCIMSSE